MARDPAVLAHQEWLGYVQPSGLVVSIPAMLEANVRINANQGPEHRQFLEYFLEDKDGEPIAMLGSFPEFAETVLGWQIGDLYGAPGSGLLPESLEAALPEYNETLRPTYALREFDPAPGTSEWILLVQVLPGNPDFDAVPETDARHWQVSPQARFERLLRQTRVPIGLLVNRDQTRLVYAPDKELSGHITFKLPEMVTVAGRPIFAAFRELLGFERLYSVDKSERLPAVLANSRKFQNVVSTQLANQVLEALYELLRGFQAANDQTQGELLRPILARDPDIVYRGLLTTLLRMVFILYAEDRGLVSNDPVYLNYYSITGLYDRLRIDDGQYPDTMDQRFGAWAQLLTLFRLIYIGGSYGPLRIPAREGYLFDPERYLFLEGRHTAGDPIQIPRVPDGVIFRVLSKLMLLDGERISYRTLAVEQIGSVYEAIMGFELHQAQGQSIAIKPVKRHGAPTTINLEELLRTTPASRAKWFTEKTDQKLTGQAADALKSATTINDLMVALERKIASSVTPGMVAKDAMIFQPSDERRRSGSHYTPSSLTGPIVHAAIEPVLKQLGENPTPDQILALKVCDPAMGSGAFLVEACRQLGEALLRAWHAHNELPFVPPDEDENLYAQRQVAQRCLYGVDRNPMAADLAKLSLWLATLAKDHPFTFLDHALRSGDSLVGLSRKQITAFHWDKTDAQQSFLEDTVRARLRRIGEYRQRILDARDLIPYAQLEQHLEAVDEDLGWLRRIGDTVIASFFSAEKPKAREAARQGLRELTEKTVRSVIDLESNAKIEEAVAKLYAGPKGIRPFHWELEFPEVFRLDDRGEPQGGFDTFVGNPPFAGKVTLSAATSEGYLNWLQATQAETHGNSDLVAYFFRRTFALLRQNGCLGLIATNTIGQGDTRSTGLQWICKNGGSIYRATRRLRWPGLAAVNVSVVHIRRGTLVGAAILDGVAVPTITAYLFHSGGHDAPSALDENAGGSFQGSILLGKGFIFDNDARDGITNRISDMDAAVENDPSSKERIQPYVGVEEVNNDPEQKTRRFVINFGLLSESESRQWPELMRIIEEKVKPERLQKSDATAKKRWWQHYRPHEDLYAKISALPKVLVSAQTSKHRMFAFQSNGMVYDKQLNVFAFSTYAAFATLQSRPHEVWSLFFGSTFEDRPIYTLIDCFNAFPFSKGWSKDAVLEVAGERYYSHRATLMVRNHEGLTETYNRFHDPNEDSPDILRLRELHAAMDRAILDAYSWQDIQPVCEFIPEFDDEEDEDENSRPKKKKYRYKWPEAIHDEVLARLLELNRQRAEEERRAAEEAEALDWDTGAGRRTKTARKNRTKITDTPLFVTTEEE
jgi:N-6 DNA Methylase